MIGTKLHSLLNELTPQQHKTLMNRCLNSNQKILQLFHPFLQKGDYSTDSIHAFIRDQVESTWPDSTSAEKEVKLRRIASVCAFEAEDVILESYLEHQKSLRSILLAQALEKRGNTTLLEQYYDKGYQSALKEEDVFNQLTSLKGLFRMNYASMGEKELHRALETNERFLRTLQFAYEDRLIEYYHNKTNIYLEKNSLIDHEKEDLEQEIQQCLKEQHLPLNKASLYFSLAKLNFNSDSMQVYLEKGKKCLSEVSDHSLEYEAFQRKARFLELRLNFFSGKSVKELLTITQTILQEDNGFTVMNNNTLFYHILLCILDGNTAEAEQLLIDKHLYFRGNGRILSDFLHAVLAERKHDYRKAIHLLNQLMYTPNYFFAVFARLLFISIQIRRGNSALIRSVLDSTLRMLQNNPDSPLGKEAHLYTLRELRNKIASRKHAFKGEVPHLTVFHQYLLEMV